MKHINLTQMLQGCSKRNGMTVSASNPDGEPTVNRQSRLMSLSGKKAEKEQLSPSCLLSASFPLSFRSRYLRYAAMIFCVLAMSVGQAWATDFTVTLDQFRTTPISGLVKIDDSNLSLGSGALQLSSGNKDFTVSTTNSDYKIKKIVFTTTKAIIKYSGDAISENTFQPATPGTSFTLNLTASGGTAKITQMVVTLTTATSETLESLVATALSDNTYTTSSSVITITTVGGSHTSTSGQEQIKLDKSSGERSLTISAPTGTNLKFIAINYYDAIFSKTITASTGTYTAATYTWAPGATPTNTVKLTFNTGNSEGAKIRRVYVGYEASGGGGCTSISPTWSTDYSSTTLNVGATSSTPVVGKDGSSGAVTFSSSDTYIATVNSSGVVTGVGAGTATITATVAANGEKCEGTVTKSFTIEAGVTYNANGADGGSVPTDDNTYAYNADIIVAGNTGSLYKTGFVFNGWNTRSDGTGTHYEAGATMKMPSKSTGVTLYAEWVGYATSWEWWNSGQSNDGTDFTYLTDKNYLCSFKSSEDKAVASWDMSGGVYYRGIKIKTKDHSIAFWVQTGKRVSITFGTRPTKPTFTVGGVDKSSDVGASENKDSITVTYTTTGDTKFYIENETATNTAFTVKSVKIEDDATCPDAYSFHYGPAVGDWETPICFEKVGDTHEWNITGFEIPDHTNGQFYVGYAGSTNGQSQTRAWTTSYSADDGEMLLLPTTGSIVGQAVGAKGTIVIWDNSGSANQYVGFKPDGYAIMYGGDNYVFNTTATANMLETNVVTLPNVGSTTYQMGIKTASSYTTCAHSKAAEALSAMSKTDLAGGNKKVYLDPNTSIWDSEGSPKYAVYDVTHSSWGVGGSDFMTDPDGDGIYEGYVADDCEQLYFARINPSDDAPSDGWNRTEYQSVSAPNTNFQNKYTIKGWSDGYGGSSSCSGPVAMSPTTGETGKFRMWANSADLNWYVHFIPYYVLSYDANGGSGTTAQTERNSESSTLTVSVASNGFTAPTGYTFNGWNTLAGGGGDSYAEEADYTLTADATLYAQWAATNYTLSYNLNGGSVASDNPTSYTIESSAITLNNPTKTGYTFAGWTGTGLDAATAAVTIAAGSTGNRSYTATWTANKFDVTHTLSHVTRSSGGEAGSDKATYGTAYSVTFAASSGYTLPDAVTVTVGGSNVTANCTWNQGTGILTIPAAYVTGAIVITVTGEEEGGGDCTPINASITFDNNKSAKFGVAWTESDITTSGGASYTLTNCSSDAAHDMTKPAIKGTKSTTLIQIDLPSGVTSGTISVDVATYNKGAATVAITNSEGEVLASTTSFSSTTVNGEAASWTAPTLTTLSYSSITAGGTYYIKETSGSSNVYIYAFSATGTKECDDEPAGEDPIPALISYYLQTPNSKTQPTSLSTDSIVTTPKRLKGDTLKNFVPVTLGSSLSITKAGKGDGGTWSAGIGSTPADSATAVTDAYAAKLAFDIHDDYELNISSITLNVKSVTNASQIYRVKVTDGVNTVYGRVAPGKDSDNSVVFGSFSGIKFSGTVTLTLWVWSTAAADYRLKSPIQIDGTLTRKASACTMPTQTFSTGAYTLGGDALNLSTLFSSNSSGAVTYSVVSAGGTSATIVGSSFTASNTGTATIRATQAADGEGNYCAKSIETTITVSGDCTPQSLSKVVVTGGSAGTVTGYNGDEYAGSAVISVNGSTTDSTNIDGESGNETGYKMTGSGTAIVFATLKKGTFLAGDQVRIGITRRNDTRQVDSKYNVLTIYYGTNKDDATALATINTSGDNDNGAAEHEGAGFYTYTLTAANVTTIGSKKGIGLFRASDNGQNPFVYSVEIIGCRDWTTCTAPTAVVAGSVTATGATFTITDAENTNNYEIYYSESSTAPTAETSAIVSGISSKSRAVTGLKDETTYYYWVRSNCGGATKSSWVTGTPASFTTEAAATTYSVTYNENGSTGGSVPTDASTYEEGDVVTVKGNTGSLAKTGNSFVGWNTASDGTGVFYPAGYKFYMDDANVTLYAVWVTGSCTTIAEGAKNASNNAIVGTTGTVTTTGASSNSSYVKLNNDDVSSSRFDVAASAGNAPFAAGDKLTVTVHNTASKGEKTMGFKIKGKAHTASVPASSSLGIEYTLTAADIESNGAIKIARNSSDDRYEAILVERCIIGTTFTVSFDMKDHGSAIADIENVPNGSKIGAPVPEPTAADYNFGGWYKDDELSDDWDFANDQVTENTTLYAKWGNCAPTITTHPVAANYNQNGVAAALTVVAATNGGGDLHYQWWVKENDLEDEDGSVIPGETGISFTPSTALLGTSYYYCVVSNDCGNVKTNTAEVTIRDTKPAPTAVWTVAEPKHGGKGFTFSVIAKNDDGTDLWDGTLTEEMLSVSSEAVLGDVEVNNTTKTISGTYGVKASATSPVTFYLLLPATETLAAKRLDKDRSFEACAGGDGSTHDIRVLKANKNITFGGGTVYGWDNPGEGFLTASTGGTVSTAKAGTKMESVFDTVYNTNKKAFWVMPYAAGIKKIKVYGDVRVKELVVSNVRKVTSFTSGKDANNIAFSAAYEGGGDNVASTGYHWFEIILEDALDANDIIYFTVSENFQISGVRVTEGTSSGSLYTSLEWSNSQSDGATLVKREDDVDFAVTANRNDANALASLGTISYSSSNTSVATVNAATGQVTIADNIDFGSADSKTTTITATLAASGCYKRCVLTYVLQVNKYVCTEAVGTVIIKTDNACSGKELEVSGYEAGATIQWYKDGAAILGEMGTTYTATTAGAYYAVTHKDCDAISNEITINFGAATATKIVDEWYVKNDRRTPDIALVQTTNATGFTVTNKSGGATVSDIGGCTFELKEDGIIYLHGTDNGDAPSGMTDGDITLVITATACVNASPVEITIHRQEQRADGKPSVAFVVDGTLRKDGGTATSVLAAKTSDRPLWKYLANTFALTGCNAYWSVDSKELRQYYSQFDAILITDDPSTSTSGTGGVSYVKAFGTMVDVRPVLTMEAYVGKFKDGGWHVYDATPTSPNPRQVELKLECKNHDIFKGLNPATSDNVRTTTDEYGNEYWHVIMVDTTQSPYHNTTSNYEALPALQGFDPNKFDKMLGVGTIFDGKLQGGVERQEEPAARMMILGIQNNAMGALTNEGKLIVKNALEYLLKTNMEDVNDCANYFTNASGDNQWDNLGNWTGDALPDFETRARILAPVEISTVVRVAHIDIITDGESGKVANPEGRVTIKPTGTLIVGGTINRAKAPYYGIDNLMPTTPSDLILETSSTSQSALIFDNSNGETQAKVTVHSEAHYDAENDKDYWQYLTSPLQETPVTEFFYGVGTYTYRHCEAEGGWVRYGLGTTFQAFDAIGLTQNDKKDFVFYGPLAPTGEWELNLTKEHSGNNLFGNSWTAPIDLKALVNNTDFDSNIELDLAIYNTGSDRKDGSGEFDQLDNADVRPGTWHHVPLNLATLEAAGWTGMTVIPAYQAFQLKANGTATLNIDYDKCVRGSESANYNEYLRAPRRPGARQAERDIEALRIAVSDANGIAYIYLLEGNQFTEGYDNGWELGYKANSKYGKLYAISPEQGNMMALARPSLEGTMVGFQPGESSEYTITFNETDGYYYLNDLKMEQSTLIQAGESYTFSVEEGESANRFLISSVPFNKPGIVTGVTNPDAEAPKVQKVIYNDKLYIIRGGRVFSADGQLVK